MHSQRAYQLFSCDQRLVKSGLPIQSARALVSYSHHRIFCGAGASISLIVTGSSSAARESAKIVRPCR